MMEAWCRRCGKQSGQQILRACGALHNAKPNALGWVYLPPCRREGCATQMHLPKGPSHELSSNEMAIFRALAAHLCSLKEEEDAGVEDVPFPIGSVLPTPTEVYL